MPSIIDRRLHAAIETKQHETLLRVEGIADKAVDLVSRAARDALQLIMDGSVVHRNQREAAEVLNGMVPAIISLFDQQFRRLHYWSYAETVRILSRQIPRRWFRRVLPAAVLVGEADGLPISGTDIWADTFTEPVAGNRLSDSGWQKFLKDHLFPPPTAQQVARAVYAPVAGMNWQQRLDVLSRKITDMNRLSGILVTGASSGMTQAELKRQIQPVVQNIASSAARIARTEGLRIATSAQREQYSELGDMLAGVQIVATLDENTRPHHGARNGRIYWADRSKKPTIDELPMLPDEPNCRCYDTPVLHPPEEFESDPALRAEFQNAAGQAIPDPQVYSQWFAQADVGRRKMAVGSKRYAEAERILGRTPQFTDFVGDDGAMLSVSALKRESPHDRVMRQQLVSQQMLHRQELLAKASRYGFVSRNDQGPPDIGINVPVPAGPFHRGIKAPVSKALQLSGTKGQQEIITRTLQIIDGIHGDGDLPKIDLKWSKSTSWNGCCKSRNGDDGRYSADSIQVSTHSDHPHMTAAHEIGHFLDQQGIGSRRFASGDTSLSPLLETLFKAIHDSSSVSHLRTLLAGPELLEDAEGRQFKIDLRIRKHIRYLLTKEELFARAYAQYIAARSGNETMLKELSGMKPAGGDTIEVRRQWSDEDFRPIATAFDGVFRNLGWLK